MDFKGKNGKKKSFGKSTFMDLDQRAKRASIIENTTVKKNTDWLKYERTLKAKNGGKMFLL